MTGQDKYWAGADQKINYDGIIVDLNGKADRDMTNVVMSKSFKSEVAGLSQLGSKAENIAFASSGHVLCSPSAGQLVVSAIVPSTMMEDGEIKLVNNTNGDKNVAYGPAGREITAALNVAAHQNIAITYNMPQEAMQFKFIYLNVEE